MDNLSRHIQPLPRRYPGETPAASIGFIPIKRDRVDHAFDTFNTSFILAGCGDYHVGDRHWRVEAPCVITQWPGVHATYGPDDWWQELYVTYAADVLPAWRRLGVAREDRPLWQMRSAAPVVRRIEELRQLLTGDNLPQRIDEVDRLCELMIVASLLSRPAPKRPLPQQAIHRVRAYVDEHFAEPVIWEMLAGSHGMSLTTFRRHWSKHMPVPPGEYLTQVRIRRACELLVETALPVGRVGREVGYDDELYFSRRFHQITGATATAYRRQHAQPAAS